LEAKKLEGSSEEIISWKISMFLTSIAVCFHRKKNRVSSYNYSVFKHLYSRVFYRTSRCSDEDYLAFKKPPFRISARRLATLF
jgi:hypothetical protein